MSASDNNNTQSNGSVAMAKGQAVESYGSSTRALHAGSKPSHWTHSPIMPPLYMSTTFEVLDPGNAFYDYSRSDNPTRTELQNIMAALEFAKYSLAFSSGLGALTTITYLLESGQHVLCCDDVYGGTFRLFDKCLSRMGIETTYVDGIVAGSWAKSFRPGKTKMVWLETPTNPTLKVIDIEAVVAEVKAIDPECIVVADNTFMSPIFQNPLKLGADIVSHSCSKYLGGHSDIIMGAIMTSNEKLYSQLKFFQNSLGITPSTFDCHLMIRSIKTLQIRVNAQEANAIQLAKYLEKHPKIEKVIYPGLESHPQHELVKRQCSGFGAMLSIYVKELNGLESGKIMRAVKIFHPAESLGCVCSLIEVPALMTHASVPEVERAKLGITNNMLRLSAGTENIQDLIQDLEQALDYTYKI